MAEAHTLKKYVGQKITQKAINFLEIWLLTIESSLAELIRFFPAHSGLQSFRLWLAIERWLL